METLCININIFNFFFSIVTSFITGVVYYFSSYLSKQFLIKNFSPFNLVKKLLVFKLSIILLLNISNMILFFYFFKISSIKVIFDYSHILYSSYIINFDFLNLNLSLDFIGIIFANLAFFVALVSLLALDTRFYNENIKFIFICNLLAIVIHVFTLTSNYILFFILYELLLIPSFLFVYFISPGKKSIQASLYFVIWTQIGSFLVLIAVSYMISVCSGFCFKDLKNFNFTKPELYFLYFFLFLGFGFKVPIWPFHYWITKTHVEAPTGFSMFLSGFLVKSAIYGYYKFSTVLGPSVNTTIFSVMSILGVIDASLKMWGQTDLKKLVAYATIQEMGLIYLIFCWGDHLLIYCGVFFSITHAFLSCLFFFLVDCINRRFNSRNIVEVSGVLHVTPNLGIIILLSCILFSGLPGTMKFICELYIFSSMLTLAPFSLLLILISANFLGILGFSKVWFNAVFGLNPKIVKRLPKDLMHKELYIVFLCFFFLFCSGIILPMYF